MIAEGLPTERQRLWPFALAWLVILVAISTGCTVRLIADYDEQIDRAATELQKRMDQHLSLLKATSDRSYASHAAFYLQYGVDVRSVKVRAQAQPKNDISVQQYDLMLQNLETLRGLHESRDTLSDAAIDSNIDLFNAGWTAIISLEMAKKRGAGGQPGTAD